MIVSVHLPDLHKCMVQMMGDVLCRKTYLLLHSTGK